MSGLVDQPKTHASQWNQSALEQGQELSFKILGNQTYPIETKPKLSWRNWYNYEAMELFRVHIFEILPIIIKLQMINSCIELKRKEIAAYAVLTLICTELQ